MIEARKFIFNFKNQTKRGMKMKKITSAILALAMLFTLCACQNEPEENETSVQSETESTHIIPIDPGSMFSSDTPSSDVPSNEGSKPDEITSSEISSELDPELTPEEKEEEARIQKALNNPGASLDYDVFLVDAPEEGNEWKLLRYNMEEEKLYEEFSFSPKNATGSYTVEFTDEYVGNILKVTFEDGMSCYIDVEKNRFYNSSEFKGLSKTLSVTKRNIGVTKNGQYEVWTTSHPDYGKTYYSELNEDENLLLTVFLKNNKYTFTSYNYETKTFKNLFTMAQKPEVKLLNDGWFIYGCDGKLYISNVTSGARELLTTTHKRGYKCKEDSFLISATVTDEIFDSLIEESRKGNVNTAFDRLWWWKQNGHDLYVYSYVMGGEEINFSVYEYAYTDSEDSFVSIGDQVIIKMYPEEREYSWQTKEEAILLCNIEERQLVAKSVQKNVGGYYVFPGGTECVAFDKNKSKWVKTALLSEKQEIVIERDVLANPCIAYDNSIWILEPFYASGKMEEHYKLYRYYPETRKTYQLTVYPKDSQWVRVSDNVYLTLEKGHDGKDYLYARVGLFYDIYEWRFSPETYKISGWSNFYIDNKYISSYVTTDNEDIRICEDGTLEVWNEHSEYGAVERVYRVPNTDKAIIVFEDRKELKNFYLQTVTIYDYDTKKISKIFSSGDSTVFPIISILDSRYVAIAQHNVEGMHYYSLYIYDIKTDKISCLTEETMKFVQPTERNFNGKYGMFYYEILDGGGRYYFFDIKENKKYVLLDENKVKYSYSSTTYTENALFVRMLGNSECPLSPLPLYMCTLNKTVCISEKALHYCVVEDQGYVMYYEEQADGSFEWKYYNF